MNTSRGWKSQEGYIPRVWSIASRFINVALLNGSPNESVSSRCYRILHMQKSKSIQWKVYGWLANKLFFWQENHIKKAYYYNISFCEEFLDRHYALVEEAYKRKDVEIEEMFSRPVQNEKL